MSYLSGTIDNKGRREAIREAVLVLKRHRFDTIVVRGVSGLLVGPCVSLRMNKRLIVVRKGESTHSCRHIEHDDKTNVKRYVIVDDLVSSGATMNIIVEDMRLEYPGAEVVGIFQYSIDGRASKEYWSHKVPQLDNGSTTRETATKKEESNG